MKSRLLVCLTIVSLSLAALVRADEKPAVKPAEEPAVKPAEKPAEKPAVKPAEKPAEKPAVKPAVKPAEKPAVKPAEKPVEKPAEKPVEKPAAELKKLDGVWKMASLTRAGVVGTRSPLFDATWTVKDGKITFNDGKGHTRSHKISIDESKNPKTIDFTYLEGPDKGKKSLGIFKMEGDGKLVICWAEPGKERPTKFSTGANPNVDLQVLTAPEAKALSNADPGEKEACSTGCSRRVVLATRRPSAGSRNGCAGCPGSSGYT